MTVKIGINGFGRIGRLAFRRIAEVEGLEVVAINNISTMENAAYLLKYDTAHRPWRGHDIKVEGTTMLVDGKAVQFIGEKDPAKIKWSDYGVDLVLECTGIFKDMDSAALHMKNGGVKGVVISAPGGKGVPTFVYGVNHEKLSPDMTIISASSCTTNCLAPISKVLNDTFGIEGGFMTTVHAYTNDQTTLDLVKESDFRRGRAAASNIVPSSTGAAKSIDLVIPELKGRLNGGAFRVPVIDGSLVDLTVGLKTKGVSVEAINAAMKKASETVLKDVLAYTEEQVVSSDILGETAGSIFDATQTKIVKTPEGEEYVKVVSWYDNEYSYTCQYIRTTLAFAKTLGLK